VGTGAVGGGEGLKRALRQVWGKSESEVKSGGERGGGGSKGAEPEEAFRTREAKEGARVGGEQESEESGQGGRPGTDQIPGGAGQTPGDRVGWSR
jgi:hypothetical protein